MSGKASSFRSWIRDRTWRPRLHWVLRRIDVPGKASDIVRGESAESEAPAEIAIKAAVGRALEERRQQTEAAVKPLWDELAATQIPERNFGRVAQELEGRIERIHADSRGGLIGAERERGEAQEELDQLVEAAQCRRNEIHSHDTSRLRWSAAAIVLTEAAVGAGVFGDYSRGGMAESFMTGGVIGGANVICGVMCGWGWQAGWKRPTVKVAATGGSVAVAGAITLAAAHYREALSTHGQNALERAVETLLASPFQPLASLPLLILVAFGAFAFLHIVRTWLSIFGRVPGYRKRALRVLRAKQRLANVETVANAEVSKATDAAKAAVLATLARGHEAHDSADAGARSILGRVSSFYGEKDDIREIGNERLALFSAIAARRSGEAWPARTVREDFGLPLAIDDPRPVTKRIEAALAGLEASRAGIMLMIERLGAAAKDYITAMSSAIARGVDIGPDLARRASGPAPALARGQG